MKKFKKFVCAALVAAVSACAVPTYQADAASISQLQQKRQNLASSTKKAKQEIANIKNKKLSAEQEMEAMDKVLTSIQAELDEATEDLNILTKQLDEAEKALQEATEKRDAQFALLVAVCVSCNRRAPAAIWKSFLMHRAFLICSFVCNM